MENRTIKEGKTMAIISYITIFGTLIAYIMNNSKKNSFTNFHIRQALGINVLYFANQWIIYKYLGRNAGWVVGVLIFISWIIVLIGAIQSEEKLVPFIGDKFQDWFKGIQ